MRSGMLVENEKQKVDYGEVCVYRRCKNRIAGSLHRLVAMSWGEESRGGQVEAHDETRLPDRIYIDPVPPPGYHHLVIGTCMLCQGRCYPNLLDVFQGSGPDICTETLAAA